MESMKQALAQAAGGVVLRAAKALCVGAATCLAAPLPAHASPGDTYLVSRSPITDQAATGWLDTGKSISADGRFVAFDTDTPLVPADINRDHPSFDVYVHEIGATRTPTFAYLIHPAGLDFGERVLGTATSSSFWLENTGSSSLPVQKIHLAGRNRQAFSRWHRCEFLFPGESCRVRITLDADSVGQKSATLRVVAGIDTVRTRPVSATVVPPASR